MKDPLGSIYPAFLESGLAKLHHLGIQRELLSLFSALENFRRDLHASEDVAAILQATADYVRGLKLFHTTAFYLVNPSDLSFDLIRCYPTEAREHLEPVVGREIQAGRFARALRQGGSVLFQASATETRTRGVFHVMTTSKQVVGMFCGLMQLETAPVQEIAFCLLSTLLGASADAVASARKTTELKKEIKTLSGLLPICAWCKRIRTGEGQWQPLEHYVASQSKRALTHGICPDCGVKLLNETPCSG